MNNEIWKDIPGYEGLYKVSNKGRVESFSRRVPIIMKNYKHNTGYYILGIAKMGVTKKKRVHQLVAMAFLDHKPNGYSLVVDHINANKLDNRVENLQLISVRENISKEKRGTSKYTGVSWDKKSEKWRAGIRINKNPVYLGSFTKELDAANAYSIARSKLEKEREKL